MFDGGHGEGASAAGEGPAVDGVELAGDPRALVGAEVDGHPGNVLAAAGAAERDLTLDHGVPPIPARDVVEAEGVDDAGADRIHPDAVTAELRRHRARERMDARLRRRVRGRARRHQLAADRRDVDDAAAVALRDEVLTERAA